MNYTSNFHNPLSFSEVLSFNPSFISLPTEGFLLGLKIEKVTTVKRLKMPSPSSQPSGERNAYEEKEEKEEVWLFELADLQLKQIYNVDGVPLFRVDNDIVRLSSILLLHPSIHNFSSLHQLP